LTPPPTNLRDELILAILGVSGPRPKALQWLIANAMPGGLVFTTRESPANAGVSPHTLIDTLRVLEQAGLCVQITRGVYKLRLNRGFKRPPGADN